jgi:hypothetical protein
MTVEQARERRLEWWRTTEKATLESVALACCTTPEYLRMLVYGHRRPQTDLAKLLGQHSGLPREFWRPDVW